jgi:hypothetical protein
MSGAGMNNEQRLLRQRSQSTTGNSEPKRKRPHSPQPRTTRKSINLHRPNIFSHETVPPLILSRKQDGFMHSKTQPSTTALQRSNILPLPSTCILHHY